MREYTGSPDQEIQSLLCVVTEVASVSLRVPTRPLTWEYKTSRGEESESSGDGGYGTVTVTVTR